MTRIYKYYHLPLPGAESMVTLLSMSSYPGTIHSGDTYIMADSGLVITETQLELIDFFKYDNVKDFPFNAHLPNWVHLLITTRLASTGAEWAKIWSTQNTGTLMSQWLIVDYNLYKAGKPLPDNLLWIVEQVPGQIESRDMTQYLRSVNRPFFQSVRDVSGFTKAQASHGALYSVNDCRAAASSRAPRRASTRCLTCAAPCSATGTRSKPTSRCCPGTTSPRASTWTRRARSPTAASTRRSRAAASRGCSRIKSSVARRTKARPSSRGSKATDGSSSPAYRGVGCRSAGASTGCRRGQAAKGALWTSTFASPAAPGR